MRFQFTRSGGDGLPVIPVIPDHRLSTIEGRNGIGKTLAARVLQFVSGEQPFAALPKAWESFCNDLGLLTVTIDGFPGGEIVRCQLDSSSWRGRSEADCRVRPGDAFINDEVADWEAVRNLIQVRRIAGDEGLSETLARTLRETSLFARDRDRETSAIVDDLGAQLGELTDNIVSVRAGNHVEDIDRYRLASRELDAAKKKADDVSLAQERAATRVEGHQAIAATLAALPQMLLEHAAASNAHAQAEASVQDADRKLTDFGRQQVVNAENEARINWLVGRLPSRMRLLADARVDEQAAHSYLKVEARLSDSERRRRTNEVDLSISKLEEENRSSYLAGTVREAQKSIEGELRAMPKSAQQERIATIGRDIRVHELADGIAARRKQLEGIPKPDEVAERERAIERLRNERTRLTSLPDIYRRTDQKQKLVDDGLRELIELRGAADEGQAFLDANERATSARTDMLTATVALRERQAAIETAIGLEGDSAAGLGNVRADVEDVDDDDDAGDNAETPPLLTGEQIAERVAEWVSRVGGEIDQRASKAWADAVKGSELLATRIERCETVIVKTVATLSAEAAAAEAEASASEERLADSAAAQNRAEEIVRTWLDRLGDAVRSLHDEAGPWAPYRKAVDGVLDKVGLKAGAFADLAENPPRPSDLLSADGPRCVAILTATQAVRAIDEIAGEVEAAAARVRDQWSNAANYLYQFSGELSTRLDDSPFDARSMRAATGAYLTKWAEHTISDLLSSPELRAELFSGSDVVSFNMTDLTVSWTESVTNRKRRRPIEAFSSGEQVFAYTKAKLERLRGVRQHATQVVVFLDEFGAFVARDRFAQLVTYIEHDALGTIADQIVVTVPLSGSLEQVRDGATLANLKPELFDPPGYVVVPARTE